VYLVVERIANFLNSLFRIIKKVLYEIYFCFMIINQFNIHKICIVAPSGVLVQNHIKYRLLQFFNYIQLHTSPSGQMDYVQKIATLCYGVFLKFFT